jgi:polysaccharide chain length determinant protein (PEP-CTERM system associated)
MSVGTSASSRPKVSEIEISPAHYLQIVLHRKWIVATIFVVVSVVTVAVTQSLPNIYSSETVIMVDPQKVPESYVKATVTGDVRNRLGTLTQQILSASRLQKIIETLNLYPEDRKTQAREDVITNMRKDINVTLNSSGSQQDLQSFRISYSGRDPRLVARVTSELASLFIEENLKAREQQAAGTTEFLQHQLEETRKTLETQEAQLRDFRLKHMGEMPEHQVANLTVLGQLQASLQQESDGLSRAEQQRTYLQTMMAQATPVVDMDAGDQPESRPAAADAPKAPARKGAGPVATVADDKARLKDLLTRYTDKHPEVTKLRQQIADRETREKSSAPEPAAVETVAIAGPPVPAPPKKKQPTFVPLNSSNPVLLSQLKAIETEIAKHKEEQQRLNKLVGSYQAKLEAIPVREQQIAELVRDYEINKSHYSQLLNNQLSAETASQLELRQKGEKFAILDPAQVPERPAKPNRPLINAAGSMAGLILGFLAAIGTELMGMTISSSDHIPLTNGNRVLEVIPFILTETDRKRRRKQAIMAAASGLAATVTFGAVLFFHYRR